MQPWQCIALIVLTVAVFLYATFLDEINKTAESSLTSLVEQTSPPREESSFRRVIFHPHGQKYPSI